MDVLIGSVVFAGMVYYGYYFFVKKKEERQKVKYPQPRPPKQSPRPGDSEK